MTPSTALLRANRRQHHRHRLIALVLCAALAACGGGGGGDDGGPAAPTLTILAQPLDSQTTAGSAARFSISAQGEGLAYQWQRSTDGGATWAAIAGATGATLDLAAVSAADNGHLFRAILSLAGVQTSSAAARLAVAASVTAPAIHVPPANLQVVAGADAQFSTTATGTTLAYQWQSSTDGLAWTDLAGQTGATLTLAAVAVDSDGLQLRVVVSNTAGSVTSAAARLGVQAPSALPSIGTEPAAVSVTAPTPATFSVVASGQPAPAYQWQRSTDGGTTYADIDGATAASYTTGPTSLADDGQRLRVRVSNTAGSVLSQAPLLTVRAATVAPAFSQEPQDLRVAAGQAVSFTTSATGTPTPGLQWQLSTDGGSTWANIVGATGTSHGFTAAAWPGPPPRV